MTRRLRKHPQHHAGYEAGHAPRRRFPFGIMWLVLTLVVLALVLWYDRRAIHSAQEHIETGRELQSKGLYVEAIGEYDQAFSNNRLGRKPKAQVAISMAEIYYNNLEDFGQAHHYYVLARQISPSTLDDKTVQAHAKDAEMKAKQSASFTRQMPTEKGGTTQTVVQRVDLIRTPAADDKGPVIATYNGGVIKAGELLRALSKRPEFLRPDFREDPAKLRAFLDGVMREDLAYEAAITAGIQKDPDVTERLFDYQKQLITQRYMVARRDEALVVTNADVEKYYNDHRAEYVKPGQITVGVLKSDSETSAAEMLQMLRDGRRFEDVATSYSQHKETAARGGVLGVLKEKDTTLPGIGEAPQVIEGLFKLPEATVTEVTPIAGAYYIFKVLNLQLPLNVTLDEARPRIENILRGRSVDQARAGLDAQLKEQFEPQVDERNLQKFWDYASEQGLLNDGGTTRSASAATAAATTSATAETTEAATTR